MLARRILAVLVTVGVAFTTLIGIASGDTQIAVPTTIGQSVTVSWTGTVLPGANTNSECGQVTDIGADIFAANLSVPDNLYSSVSVSASATITFDGPSDMIVTIVASDGRTSSADAASFDGDESTSLRNPPAGSLKVISCMFAGALPQAYTGTLTLTASAPAASNLPCKAPGKALTFTTPSYVDTTRAGGEPSVQALSDGTLLYAAHAGTTHFYSLEADDPDSEAFFEKYRGQVHAYVSGDGGATWAFVDRTLPPDNAAGSGFSDPDFAVDVVGNVYLSEINLANVAMSKSTDNGHSYKLQNFLAMTVTDRQWTAAGPGNYLYMVGNAEPGGGSVPSDPAGNSGHLIYRSTDGGQTFSEAVQDEGGLGDLTFDHRSNTLYEAHYTGGALQVAAFRNAIGTDALAALTPEINSVATGVDLAAHWPSMDVDALGNLYIVWDERGEGDRNAGVYTSFSTDGGRTWATPARVDKNDNTDLWPWIAVGSPGRVAVAWMENDHKLPGNDPEQATAADPWNVVIAQTLNGLGCDTSDTPGYRVTRATPQPFHIGTVCTGGTICQAQLVDRRLGDYFTIDIDPSGHLVAAYSDTRQGGAVALPAFFAQTGGTIFNKGKPH